MNIAILKSTEIQSADSNIVDELVQEKIFTDRVNKCILYESNWKAISKFRPQTQLLHSVKSFEDMYSVLSKAQSIVKN